MIIRIMAVDETTDFQVEKVRMYSGRMVIISAPSIGPMRLNRMPPTITYIITLTEAAKLNMAGLAIWL
jgi:hypothetical protein